MTLTIGALAEAAGVNIPTVRYYERRGILPRPPRTASGYRLYDSSTVERIRFIKRAQDLGFTLEEIDELLRLRVDDPAACAEVEEVARAKLAEVEAKLRELGRLRTVLRRLVRSCRDRERTDECPILRVLDEIEVLK